MTETLIDRMMTALRRNYPGASATPLRDGSYAVTVPMDFPEGYSVSRGDVVFYAPVGFPSASPAYFWTDESVRLSDGEAPAFTSVQHTPEGEPKRWWNWKPSEWNPNRHNLLTFARQIQEGLARTLSQQQIER